MRWGLQDSVGHYLDLYSCVLGLTLFAAGYIAGRLLAALSLVKSRIRLQNAAER